MRIELSAYELLDISIALGSENVRLLEQYIELPKSSPEKDEVWNKYHAFSGLRQKVYEAYQKADRKERLERSYPKVA